MQNKLFWTFTKINLKFDEIYSKKPVLSSMANFYQTKPLGSSIWYASHSQKMLHTSSHKIMYMSNICGFLSVLHIRA